jgi:hypothetical protein
MQRTLLTLALIAAAGAAVAQTSQGPSTAHAGEHATGQATIAQKRIEADGYKNVQGLALGSDGLWHGRAMRGSAEVQVTVDRRGNVVQQ